MSTTPPAPIRAYVFDAYGTLFDVHTAVGHHKSRLGDKADAVSAMWRTKQLEYTWLRSLMGEHAAFWQVTGEAQQFLHVTARFVHDTPASSSRASLAARAASWVSVPFV